MSKKIISFTLLSISLLFSLMSLEAMKFGKKARLKTPKISKVFLARRFIAPALAAAAGATYALGSTQNNSFKPTILRELTQEEKNEPDLLKRFSMDYIGTPPDEIKTIIKHFENFQKKTLLPNSEWENQILLHGIPGVGKNEIVSALGRSLEADCYMLNSTRFVESYAGDTGKNIEIFFTSLKNSEKFTIVYLDEIDSVVNAKDVGQPAGEYTAARATLLIEIENIAGKHNILLLAGVNDPKTLSQAFRNRFTHVKVNPIEKQPDIECFFDRKFQKNGLFILPETIQAFSKETHGKMQPGSFSQYNFSTRDLRKIANKAAGLDELKVKPLSLVAFAKDQLKPEQQKSLGLVVDQIQKQPIPLTTCTDDLLKTMLKELSRDSSKEDIAMIDKIHGDDYTFYTTLKGKSVRIAKLSKELLAGQSTQADNNFYQKVGNDVFHLSQCGHKDLSPAISSATQKRKEEAASQLKKLQVVLDNQCKGMESETRDWVKNTEWGLQKAQIILQPAQSLTSIICSWREFFKP